MNKSNFLWAGLLSGGLLLSGAALALSPDGQGHADRMAAIDIDGDGNITAEERAAHRATMFDQMDADGDGYLSEQEVEAFRAAKRAEHQQKRAEMMEKRQEHRREMMEQRKAAMDSDGDGAISRDEFVVAESPRLAKIDTNGDGVISAEERAAMAERRKAKKAERSE